MLWVCLEPERLEKTTRILSAFGAGWPGAKLIVGEPPDDGNPFIVWGQKWVALSAIQKALKAKRPFYQLDNGYWQPARGGNVGYYRICTNGLSARFIPNAPNRSDELKVRMRTWRTQGGHIVFAVPGEWFGRAIGLDMPAWTAFTLKQLRASTDRPIIVRQKNSERPLEHDLRNAWALVTHSSNAAVDAVLAGVPVFVAPTSPAAHVGRTDFDLESPVMPNRKAWLDSLLCQQFTLDEMQSGIAAHNITNFD